MLVLLLMAAILLPRTAFSAKADSASGEQLAKEVWQACGGENWANVKAIDFTFAVEKGGKVVSQAEHHWDVAAQTDHVRWKDKDVTVDLAQPAQNDEGKAAFARWVNDSYWLLCPLKLRDHGVKVTAEGTKEMDGARRQVLRLSFGGVGLTPTDQYRLYIDPATKRVMSWDYIPKTGEPMHGTWQDYTTSGGLTLATNHTVPGGVRIRILNLKVTSAQ